MVKSTTSSFITTIPLVVTSQAESELLSRFQAGRQLYNALLNESMARMRLVQKSAHYQLAKTLPKGKARTEAFATARKQYRYSEYDIQALATVVANKSKWIGQKIDSNTQQKLATRAFQASEKVMLGRANKVRFKVPSRFRSMEGKTNKQGIRWTGEQLIWGKLKLNGLIDSSNPVMRHGINSEIKYVRILWKEINGKRRWYAQLINKGDPAQKPANFVSPGVVGIDLNISQVAYDKSGVVMHRDLMSAFLSRHVYDDKLSLQDAQLEYPGMETTLLRAWQQYQQSANRVSASESRCSHSPVELIRSDKEKSSQIASERMGDKLDQGSEESPGFSAAEPGEVSRCGWLHQ